MKEEKLQKSGHIKLNQEECSACSRCLMACAAYHWGAVALPLSSIKWVEGDFLCGSQSYPLFCEQCDHPECYYACPLKDVALCIDSITGARYINNDECIGCISCIEACPFEITRINFNADVGIAIKCDLCKGRDGGPVCVEVCDRQALSLVTRKEK